MTNLVGTTLGQYQIVELIGEGGMAIVYKAWQPSLRRYVALKVLAPHLASDAEFVQRFHQEAVSAANLKQTHIVIIHDVGAESGYHYIAMELIEGASLEAYIRSGQPFTPDQVAGIISQIGAALDYAHQRGFIHRDIKPANILIDASGRAVLTDFGIVKALSGSGVTAALTQAGTVVGTPHYMSPEQITDEPLDHRSDLYALGIVCYEMLSGQVPFDGTTTHAIIYAQVHTPPPPLREIAGLAAPPPVEAVVNKMLAKRRENRYDSGGEFARDLAQAVSGVWPAGLGEEMEVTMPMGTGTTVMEPTPGGMPAPTALQPTPAAPYTPTAYTPTPPPMPAPARRRRWPLVLGGIAAIGVMLIVGVVVGMLVLGQENPLKVIQAALALKSAQTALAGGDDAEAVDRFSQVLDNAPDNVKALEGQLEAAANLAQAGQFDDAIAAYETVWRAKPAEVQALRGLGQSYEAQEEWGEAAGWYEKWAQVAPQDESAFLALGGARFNLGEYERAVAEYGRAEALGAGSSEMDAHLGLAYYELAQYDKAVGRLQNGVSQNPEDFELQRALGLSLYAQDQLDQAAEHLNKAIALGANRSGDELLDVYYALGGYYFGEQQYEQAISFYEQAQEFDPEKKAVWAGEARANLDEAYSRLAEGVMKEALLDLDFFDIITEGDETYAVAKTGQKVKIKGPVRLVDGPWEGAQALVVEEGTTNYCTNSSLETGATGWTSPGGADGSRSSDDARFGDYSYKVVCPGSATGERGEWTESALAGSTQYVASIWVKAPEGATLFAQLADGATSGYHVFAATGQWQRVQVAHTTTVSPTTNAFSVRTTESAQAITFYLDGLQIEQKTRATSYCDGDQGPGCFWTGTPHGSISRRTASHVDLDDYVDLVNGKDTLSFRIVVQMPYDADGTWPVNYSRLMELYGDASNYTTLVYSQIHHKFYMEITDGDSTGSTYSSASAQAFSAGDWLDIVVTSDFSINDHRVYINGELDSNNNVSLSTPSLSYWALGSNYGGGQQGSFGFTEYTVFDRALTADEVAALYRVSAFTSKQD